MAIRGLIFFAVVASSALVAAEFKPVGWRGDGSGHYPDATPPTVWYQKENGESKNILWKTKLPCYSWSTPIIVGDKIFTLSEPYDLICLNKNTGKLLWMRSFSPYMGVTDAEKAANPIFKEIEQAVAELDKANEAFLAQGWTAALYKQKNELSKKIDGLCRKADRKYRLPPDFYVEGWTGYTAPTPCSDGKFVYVVGGDGVTICYDLDGNKKWSVYESLTDVWGEHGFFASPLLVGDVLLAPSTKLRALNKETGAELYRLPFMSGYGMLSFRANDTDIAIAAGNYFRVKDGKMLVERKGDMPAGMAVVHDNMVYYGAGHVSFVKWEAKGEALTLTPLITEEYNRVTLPLEDSPKLKVDQTITGMQTASPIYHDGLLYCLGNFGKLNVFDTLKTRKADALVYGAFPGFDFRNPCGRKTPGVGIGASPALAGKYIYMIDSGNCTVVMEPGRTYKEIAKNPIIETVPEQISNTAGAKNYWHGPHQEQTEASLIFDGSRIYLRGEQFLYCIGEK
ncbi:MAG TPA: PQQ-binding-like beta-propeller repeat protein [Planctomycetota bacterium]